MAVGGIPGARRDVSGTRRRVGGPRRRARRPVVVQEDAVRRTVEIVELAGIAHPEEEPDRDADAEQRERNQEEERFHRQSLIALSATAREDSAMPIAAAHGGTSPKAATGMAVAL